MTARTSALVAAFMLVIAPRAIFAQAALPPASPDMSPQRHVFGLGAWAGSATGIGISFRHHFPARFSYQITGGIIKVDEVSYSVGGELQFDFARKPGSRLFAAGGVGYYFSGPPGENKLEGPLRIGLGIGGEAALSAEFHGTLEVLFTYFSDGTILPLPQIGFHYYFY